MYRPYDQHVAFGCLSSVSGGDSTPGGVYTDRIHGPTLLHYNDTQLLTNDSVKKCRNPVEKLLCFHLASYERTTSSAYLPA